MAVRWARPTGKNAKPETEFRKACLQWLGLRFGRHFFARKIAGGPYQRSGTLDTYCSIRGLFFAFEWKDPAGKRRASPQQAAEVEEIRSAGGRAYVIASFEDLEAAVADLVPVQLGMRPLADGRA